MCAPTLSYPRAAAPASPSRPMVRPTDGRRRQHMEYAKCARKLQFGSFTGAAQNTQTNWLKRNEEKLAWRGGEVV